MTAVEHEVQLRECWSATSGRFGYLREPYHGGPYATRHLCEEAFVAGQARIPAQTLRERLDETLQLAEKRERSIYNSDEARIAEVKRSFSDFVALCEAKEKQSGEEVLIIADY
jgi:hypothetical protein